MPKPSQILQKARCRSFLVTDLTNILYLTGLSVSAGCILVTKNRYLFFLDSRYLEAAKKLETGTVRICPLETLPKHLQKLRSIGIEAESITLSRMAVWKKKYKNTKFVQTSGVIEEFRRSKTSREISSIARACSITKSVLRLIPTLLRIGITERDLAWKIETECRKRGADSLAFESIVAFGEHSAIPHHHSTDRKLRKTDVVQIDMGAKFSHYCSDYSRVYFMEKPTRDQAKAMNALRYASAAAMKILKPGVTNRALDLVARSTLKAYGFEKEFSHALGHGVGLDIHEGVTLSSKAPVQQLRKNEVITIEPGLYFPGKWGMRIEETIVVS